MRCIHCNTQLADDAEFCTECGKKVEFNGPLIERARKGVSQAQATLYNATCNQIYVLVKSMVKDEDTVLDILQDSYVKAFRNLDQLQEPNKFRPWLKTIAKNRTMDYFRERKQVLFSEMASVDDENAEVEFVDENPAVQPEVVADRKETTRLIEEILDTLTEDQRAVVSMFYYEQMSVAEIAASLGVSENTVKTRLHYGRKKIEAQVLALEKKGTKLYGLAPLPFLLMLLRGKEAQAMSWPAESVLQTLLSECANMQESVAAAESLRQSGHSAGAPGRRAALQAAGGTGKGAAAGGLAGLMQYTAAKIIIAAAVVLAVTGVIIGVLSSGSRRPPLPQQSPPAPLQGGETTSAASGEEQSYPETEDVSAEASETEALFAAYIPDDAELEERGRRIADAVWGDTPVTEYVLEGIHFYVPDAYPLQTRTLYGTNRERTIYYWDSGEPMSEEDKANGMVMDTMINGNWNVIFDGSEDAHTYRAEFFGDTAIGIEIGNLYGAASGDGISFFSAQYDKLPLSVRQFPFDRVLASAWSERPASVGESYSTARRIDFPGIDASILNSMPAFFETRVHAAEAEAASAVIRDYATQEYQAFSPVQLGYHEYHVNYPPFSTLEDLEKEHGMPYERDMRNGREYIYYNSSSRYYLTLSMNKRSQNADVAWSYRIEILDKQPGDWNMVQEYTLLIDEEAPEDIRRAAYSLLCICFGDDLLPRYETLPGNE